MSPGRTGPVVVVGDVLLDLDVEGSADRLCPDSTAPVVDVDEEYARPGGAGLTATLLAGRREVVLVAPLADDRDGRHLARLLARRDNLRLIPLPWSGSTPVKQRIRVGGHTVARLDRGGSTGTIGDIDTRVRDAIATAAGVVVSDYGRGATRDARLRALLEDSARRAVLVWDPHPRGGEPVPGVTLATPNRSEALAATRTCHLTETTASQMAAALTRRWRAEAVAVTDGDRGAVLSFGDGTALLVPAQAVPGTDVCGAGDAFAAAAAHALAEGAPASDAVREAVVASGRFVAAGGAAAIGRHDPRSRSSAQEVLHVADGRDLDPVADLVASVRARGGTVVAAGGCFDLLHAGHVATLSAARRLGDCLIVCMNSDGSARRLKGPGRPVVRAADRRAVLASLECVDAVVIFDEDDPVAVLRRIRPDIWVKGGDYAGRRLPEAGVLAEWGGETVVVPRLEGRSTTSLVRAVQDGTDEPDILTKGA